MGEMLSTPEAGTLNFPAGYGVARECLERQEHAPERTALGRLFGVRPVHPDARSWFDGAIGEIRVGRVLAALGPEWTVLHSVPVGRGYSDIDHVVVGPGGVFTINTKRHAGKKVWLGERMLLVSGQRTEHLRNARHEASRAAKLLMVPLGETIDVRPVIVLVDVESLTVKQRPADVAVLTERRVLRWLGKQKVVLSAEQVARISAAARNVCNWHVSAESGYDNGLMARFAALQREDRTAWIRRIFWGGGFALLIALGGLFLMNQILQSFIATMVSGF